MAFFWWSEMVLIIGGVGGIEPATPDFAPDHDKQQKATKNHNKSDS